MPKNSLVMITRYRSIGRALAPTPAGQAMAGSVFNFYLGSLTLWTNCFVGPVRSVRLPVRMVRSIKSAECNNIVNNIYNQNTLPSDANNYTTRR